ncbi:MAG: hypothetical protein EHV01_000095 [Spiroplasma sp. hy2]|uniref:hypothetical protein n=1 Tax=Spiroplasma sp. hy2 TaxID=2490850 RepID=UPI00383F2438
MNNTFPSLPNLNDINSVLKFYNYDWTINLANIIARHQMRLVNGKDILFKSHRKDILEKLNWWYETYKIKEKLDKNELTASLMGKTIFGLLETSDGNIDLWINPFNFTSRVSKINEIEQGADIWLNYHQSDSGFILNLICTKDKIVIKGWPKNNEVVVGQSKTQIKDDVKPVLIQEFKNKLGVVPFWEMINEPNPLFLSTSTTLNPWPTMANCYKLQFDLEDSFNIKSKERYANRTHWYGILSDDLMTAYNKGNKKVLQDVFDDIFVQSSSSTVDGQLSQSLQVVQGTPTLETYTEDQKAIIEQVYLACHFSSPFGDKSDNDQNKTQSLLTKTKDLEKQAYLQAYRKQYYTKMFDTVLKYYGLWDGTGERPYGFDFVSASLVDQMRQNELITARLDNGTMEPIRAITEYDNIDELEATKYFEKIEEWQDKMQAKEIEHNNKLLEYDETGNNQNALQGRTEIKEN